MVITKFDLSTLNLSEGTHSITVRAKANGYLDSAESNAVSYTGVSYVIPKGSYMFKQNISLPTTNIDQRIEIIISRYDLIVYMMRIDGDSVSIGDQNTLDADIYTLTHGWIKDGYRDVTVRNEQTVSKEFYEWFTYNAVKQSGSN
jgi:hypothetical protein